MRTVVIGLGNELLRDDAVGLLVVRDLRNLLRDRPDVDVVEDTHGGLRLMERMIGYDRAVVVDAMQQGGAPGAVCCLEIWGLPTMRSASAHDVGLATALAVGRAAGAHLPADEQVLIVGIEAVDVDHFGFERSVPVQAAIGAATRVVRAALSPASGRLTPVRSETP